jgi:hypothetical protein
MDFKALISKMLEEKKLDKVNKDALKGDFKDRSDKDIDNDGEVDDQDEYLHNRRKTITKAIKKESVELDEISSAKLKTYRAANEKDRERLSKEIGFIMNDKPTAAQKKLIAKLQSRNDADMLAFKKDAPYLFKSMGKQAAKVDAPDAYDDPRMHKSYLKYKDQKESVELDEGFSPAHIAKLKAEYAKTADRISPENAMKMSAMLKKMGKDELVALYKADIKWLSTSAMTQLMINHNFKAADFKGLKESVQLDEADGWIAMYNGKKLEITKNDAKDLYSAKMYAAKELKVPKSKMGLLAISPAYNESNKKDDLLDSLKEIVKKKMLGK